jgi:biopolymer transport protein ExbD
MAMSVGPASGEEDEVVSTINTTPLVDVMLVLLIIFLITIPSSRRRSGHAARRSATRSARRSPRTSFSRSTPRAASTGTICGWPNTTAMVDRLKKIAVLDPQPEVQIRGDGGADYSSVGKIIYAVQRAGIAKVGFIMEPPPRGG